MLRQVNRVLQQSIHPRGESGTIGLHGRGVRNCAMPGNPGKVAKVVPPPRELLSEGIAKLQQLVKSAEQQVDATEVCQAPVISGNLKIFGRMAHCAITSLKVRLSRNPPNPSQPPSMELAKPLPRSQMRRLQVIEHRIKSGGDMNLSRIRRLLKASRRSCDGR